uniref:Fe2OG dioxygenase domain-containing protein n=1 Tax=Plectus sambesii TaxID=2011161 RepID=A0A914VB98_9BILA
MHIPSLNYAESLEDGKTAGIQILDAFRNPGFLFVENIPSYDSAQLLKWTRWFFTDLSKEEREKLQPNPYRGYMPAQSGKSSYKEIFEIGAFENPHNHPKEVSLERPLEDTNLWPENCDDFKEFCANFHKQMSSVGANLLKWLNGAVAKDHDWVNLFQPNSLSTLRFIYYPQRPEDDALLLSSKDGQRPLHCSEHSDGGFITLLSTFHYSGLQIKTDEDKWKDVELEGREGLVVNIGEMMVRLCAASGETEVKATKHRVADLGADRFSVPFFFEPKWSAAFDGKPYGELVLDHMKAFVEYDKLHQVIAARDSK